MNLYCRKVNKYDRQHSYHTITHTTHESPKHDDDGQNLIDI